MNTSTIQLINVVQSAVAFFCVFAAFNSQGFIQEIVISSYSHSSNSSNINEHAGYYSQSIIYGVFTLSNFIAPPVCNLFGGKWAMVLGAACYTLFLLSFLYLLEWLLYVASAVVGFGAAVLWTGQGNYMTLNSNQDTIGRNSGLFWAFLQAGTLVGGAFLYAMFSGKSSDAAFDLGEVRVLYTVFSVASALGLLLLLFLARPPVGWQHKVDSTRLAPPHSASESESLLESARGGGGESAGAAGQQSDEFTDSISVTNAAIVDSVQPAAAAAAPASGLVSQWMQQMKQTFCLMCTRNIMFLVIVFLYSGLETSFWLGVYPTCLGFTKRFNVGSVSEVIVALNAVFAGIGQIIGGGFFGVFGHRTNKYGRNPIIILGCVVHFVTFFLCFINLPFDAPIGPTQSVGYIEQPSVVLALTCSLLLGFADACWNTQIYSLLGSLYPDEESAHAFALFKAFQSAASCASFYYGAQLQLEWQLLILVVANFLACICFFPVEWFAQTRPVGLKIA